MAGQGPYRRVLLKVSGEAFCAPGGFGVDPDAMGAVVDEIASARKGGVEIALVVGGGNFLRGKTLSEASFIPRATADTMGMLATVLNALALAEALSARDIPAVATSAVPMGDFCEAFDRRRAVDYLQAGKIVILAGGTGQPFFTTDTCAALRACQIGAEVLLKATKVPGVFDADPVENPDATKFDRLSYAEVLSRRLGVMDLAAVSLCMESQIPVIVFRLADSGSLAAAIRGEAVGTIVSDK